LPEVKGKDLYAVHLKAEKAGDSQETQETLSALFPVLVPDKDPVLRKLRENVK